jgi:hypothetical protein
MALLDQDAALAPVGDVVNADAQMGLGGDTGGAGRLELRLDDRDEPRGLERLHVARHLEETGDEDGVRMADRAILLHCAPTCGSS